MSYCTVGLRHYHFVQCVSSIQLTVPPPHQVWSLQTHDHGAQHRVSYKNYKTELCHQMSTRAANMAVKPAQERWVRNVFARLCPNGLKWLCDFANSSFSTKYGVINATICNDYAQVQKLIAFMCLEKKNLFFFSKHGVRKEESTRNNATKAYETTSMKIKTTPLFLRYLNNHCNSCVQ